MKLILTLLFVGVCACADLTPPPSPSRAPPYQKSLIAVKKAGQQLKTHVLSMSKGIPDLTDYRRDYAEIVNVIYGFAVEGFNGFPPITISYPKKLNRTSPQALSQPQKVIDGIKKLIKHFDKKTKVIQDLMKSICVPGNPFCDTIIEKLASIDGPLKVQAEVLLVGGETAKAFLKRNKEFLAVSKDHSGHQYVVEGVHKLADPIRLLANLLRITHYSHKFA